MNHAAQNFVLGIDIGGTNLRIGMLTEKKELIHFEKKPIQNLYVYADPLEGLVCYIRDYLSNKDITKLKAIGIGFPSIVSKDKRELFSTPNLPGFDNRNVVSLLQKAFQVPVFIDNDVNMHVNYEINKNKLSPSGITLGFYIGTGFGNSIYINGEFLQGKNGVAGELGHIPAFRNERVCSCGNKGCIETIAAGKYLVEIYNQLSVDVPFEDFFLHYEKYPELVEFLDTIAIPVATEINILDPDYIILGGGVLQMKHFPQGEFEKKIRNYTRKPYPEQSLNIIYAENNQATGVMGAGYYVYENLRTHKHSAIS